MTAPFDSDPNDAYIKVQQSMPGADGPACVVFKKQLDGTHAPVLALAESQFNELLAALGAAPSGTPISVGTVSFDPAELALLASSANQLTLIDRVIREGARTQNVLAQFAENAYPTRITAYSIMDQYTATDLQSGVAVGDVVLCIADFTVAADPSNSAEYWTTPGAQRWIRVFDSASGLAVREILSTPIDINFATQDDSGVVTRTTFERTLTRRVIDGALAESLQTVTETRTVQASHIYPYPSIFDSGWV